ncbi:MAG: hypothetical protein K8R21_04515 [Leptospira sp.]|nr:hypothetical protein [Leptospira sp.]
MNFLYKTSILIFVFTSVLSLIVLNMNWGKRPAIEQKKITPASEIQKPPVNIFFTLMDLKTRVIADFEADFKTRKKIKIYNE